MEIRHLRYFVAVGEHEHIGRAAQRLHVSPSPLSRQIHEVEEELGVELFVRVGRGLRLTDAGKVFLDEARDVLARLDRAMTAVRAAGRGETGSLRIGFVENSDIAGLIPTTVRLYRDRHPNVRLELVPMSRHEQLLALDARQIDAALMFKVGPDPQGLSIDTLFVRRILLVVPRDHALATKRRVVARDLVGVPMIWLTRHDMPFYLDFISAALRERGVDPNVLIESPSAVTRMNLVAAGMGVTFATAMAASAMPDVVEREVDDIRIEIAAALMSRKDAASSPVLRALRDVVLEAASALRDVTPRRSRPRRGPADAATAAPAAGKGRKRR
jgi:DNA-binding transcriptional LysR family regulator